MQIRKNCLKTIRGTAGIPKFHKKTNRESYQTNPHYAKDKLISLFSGNACFLDINHLMLPKLKRIRCKGSSKMLRKIFVIETEHHQVVKIGTITISKDPCGDYFASFQLGSDYPFVEQIGEQTGSEIGIDLNVENFYANSNGEIIDNPQYYRKQKKRLANAQRKLGKRTARAKKEHRPLKVAKNY